ncbi:hypothetical protein ZIOFF_032990 [Zingiber officinale]|uniref:Uncharacterized protein n=1 Tax=Zingiber officinale TaxID=94328 RepID=A0A8J5GXX1_ZINOF|nr:hypothetical protein ZIOFF_032990 [Zingiber officinale]
MSGGDDRGDLFDYHPDRDLSAIFPAAGKWTADSDSLHDYYLNDDGMLQASGPFDASCWAQPDDWFNGGEMAADGGAKYWGNHIATPSTGVGSPVSANCSASSSSSMEALEVVKLEDQEAAEAINEEIKDREPATDHADKSKLKLNKPKKKGEKRQREPRFAFMTKSEDAGRREEKAPRKIPLATTTVKKEGHDGDKTCFAFFVIPSRCHRNLERGGRLGHVKLSNATVIE